MNIVDILILLVLGYSLFAGMYKGFLVSGVSTLGFVGAWVGALMSYESLARMALRNTPIMGFFTDLIEADSLFVLGSNYAERTVASIAGQGAEAIKGLLQDGSVGVKFVDDAFARNVLAQSFGDGTLAGYLNQTILSAIFGVLGFLVMFAILYAVITLLVNLFNNIVRFPVLRHADWALGGLFGLLRGAFVAVLLVVLAEYVLNMLAPEALTSLVGGSKLIAYVKGAGWFTAIIEGTLGGVIGA